MNIKHSYCKDRYTSPNRNYRQSVYDIIEQYDLGRNLNTYKYADPLLSSSQIWMKPRVDYQNTNDYLQKTQTSFSGYQSSTERPSYSDLTRRLLERDLCLKSLRQTNLPETKRPQAYLLGQFAPSLRTNYGGTHTDFKIELLRQQIQRDTEHALQNEKTSQIIREQREVSPNMTRKESGFIQTRPNISRENTRRYSVPARERHCLMERQSYIVPQNQVPYEMQPRIISSSQINERKSLNQLYSNQAHIIPNHSHVILNRPQIQTIQPFQTQTVFRSQVPQETRSFASSVQITTEPKIKYQTHRILLDSNVNRSPGITSYRTTPQAEAQIQNQVTVLPAMRVSQSCLTTPQIDTQTQVIVQPAMRPSQSYSYIVPNQNHIFPSSDHPNIREPRVTQNQQISDSYINDSNISDDNIYAGQKSPVKSILKKSSQFSRKKRVIIDENQNQLREVDKYNHRRSSLNIAAQLINVIQVQSPDKPTYYRTIQSFNNQSIPFNDLNTNSVSGNQQDKAYGQPFA